MMARNAKTPPAMMLPALSPIKDKRSVCRNGLLNINVLLLSRVVLNQCLADIFLIESHLHLKRCRVRVQLETEYMIKKGENSDSKSDGIGCL